MTLLQHTVLCSHRPKKCCKVKISKTSVWPYASCNMYYTCSLFPSAVEPLLPLYSINIVRSINIPCWFLQGGHFRFRIPESLGFHFIFRPLMRELRVCFLSQEHCVPSWRSWSGTSSRRNQKPWWVLSPRVWGVPTHPAPWPWPLALLSPPQQTTLQSLEALPWMTSLRRSGTNSLTRSRQSHVSLSRCVCAEVCSFLSFNYLNLLTGSNVLAKLALTKKKEWLYEIKSSFFFFVKQDRNVSFDGYLRWLDTQCNL